MLTPESHVGECVSLFVEGVQFLCADLTPEFIFGREYFTRAKAGFVGHLTSQQHASVSQGRSCSDNYTCCHTDIEFQTFYLTQSQHTDTGPTSPCSDPILPGAWHGTHWSANF